MLQEHNRTFINWFRETILADDSALKTLRLLAIRPNLNIPDAILPHKGICRNMPFCGRKRRGSRVHFPKEENARSRHQRLFVENVRKTEENRS